MDTLTRTVETAAPPRSQPRARSHRCVLHAIAPAAYGGLERVVATLARAQATSGRAVHVAATLTDAAAPPEWLGQLAGEGVEVHAIASPGRAYLRERAQLVALCRRIGADVLHSHGYRPDVIGGSAARAAGVATVSTVHGFTGGDLRNRAYEWLQQRALRGFGQVVAVSRPLGEQLRRSGIARVQVLPNAWDGHTPRLDRERARAALGMEPGEVTLGWVGRLSAEKGCDVALAALAAAGREHVRLAILGDGPERAALESQAAALGLADRVRFHGAIPGAADYFAAFDAFLLSSRTEGTPIALFEAMAAGIPLIVTAVGGVPDVVGAAQAFVATRADAESVASAICRFTDDADGAAVRASAARQRLADFSTAQWVERYEDIYGGAVAALRK